VQLNGIQAEASVVGQATVAQLEWTRRADGITPSS